MSNDNNIPHPNRLLKSDQAAAYLGISARKLWQLTQQKRIPSVKFDRVLRYDIADLEAFILQMKGANP
jgi:excisionase family DNA binding protein